VTEKVSRAGFLIPKALLVLYKGLIVTFFIYLVLKALFGGGGWINYLLLELALILGLVVLCRVKKNPLN